jgi:AraC-like DNA-binding protein
MAQLTLAEADTIIVILLFVVLLLLILGSISLYYNSVFKRRNEQLHRILDALDDYRAIVGVGELSLDEQEEAVMKKQSKLKAKAVKAIPTGEGQSFFVKMDARINKEKPFKDPYFDQKSLAEFMEVDLETFRKLVPRYKDPDRTLEYINSLRAEHAAKMLMEHMDYSMEFIASQCGFKNSAAYNSAFKFAFGITPTEYLNGVSQMFKKKKDPRP